MANARQIRQSAGSAVSPPDTREPSLRAGWGESGANDRPDRLMDHTNRTEFSADSIAGVLGGIALVMIATAVIVILFVF